MKQVSIQYWRRCDMSQVVNLEALTKAEHAEGEEYFLSLLAEEGIVGCVATVYDTVVGYMVYELFKKRLDILEFETHPKYALGSVWLKMLDNLVRKCQEHHRETISYVIPEKSVEKQLFFKQNEAKCVQIKKNFFSRYSQDGYLFSLQVPEPQKEDLELQEIKI